MTTTPLRRVAILGAGALLGLSFMSGVATAAPKSERATTTITEDNDTNDGGTANNVVDDGDNAHPSGKDRSVENGKSGTQGNAKSDPDDNGKGPDRSNGGVDQPDGKGGVDLADQDGNNGCGNDDDFEDDNEGWCGKRPANEVPGTPETPGTPAPEVKPEVKPETTPAVTPEVAATAVLGETIEAAPATETVAPRAQVLGLVIERPASATGAQVLGEQFERAPAALAMTGFAVTRLLIAVAAILLLAGFGLRRMGASRA